MGNGPRSHLPEQVHRKVLASLYTLWSKRPRKSMPWSEPVNAPGKRAQQVQSLLRADNSKTMTLSVAECIQFGLGGFCQRRSLLVYRNRKISIRGMSSGMQVTNFTNGTESHVCIWHIQEACKSRLHALSHKKERVIVFF